MAAYGEDDDRIRETYRADFGLQPRRLPRKPHWILASPPEQSVVDIFDDKGAEVARQFFLLNPGLPTIEFTVQNLIDYVVRTLFKHPKGTTLARKVGLNHYIPLTVRYCTSTASSFEDPVNA